jgi:putative membrane protein
MTRIVRQELDFGDASTELASNRTSMSFERTRMSADRTLMSVIRTALSLISFGFTIYTFFNSVAENLRPGINPGNAPRNFGLALIVLGIGFLLVGLINQEGVLRGLRTRREKLFNLGLIRSYDIRRTTMVSVVAFLLLLIGVAALASVAFRSGPFS